METASSGQVIKMYMHTVRECFGLGHEPKVVDLWASMYHYECVVILVSLVHRVEEVCIYTYIVNSINMFFLYC